MAGGRELGHVSAGLGDQHLGGATLNARDRAQQLDLLVVERAELLLDRLRQPVDRLVEEVHVGEDLHDDQGVLLAETPLQRFAQRGQLLAQLTAGQLGEHLRVGGARNERVEHRPPRLAQQV